jgi:hypothetical protein
VITGIIKANLPCQISFKVNRRIDSRVILDANGAEKLLGFGDMLYMPPGGGTLLRAQGTFVADDEMLAVVRYLEEHGMQPEFNPALMQTQTSSRPSIADSDERYRDSRSRARLAWLGIAARARDRLHARDPARLMDGTASLAVRRPKSREVLLTLDEWKAREKQMAERWRSRRGRGGWPAAQQDTSAAETSRGEADAAAAAAGRVGCRRYWSPAPASNFSCFRAYHCLMAHPAPVVVVSSVVGRSNREGA